MQITYLLGSAGADKALGNELGNLLIIGAAVLFFGSAVLNLFIGRGRS